MEKGTSTSCLLTIEIKAYDKVPRELLWRCFERKSVPVAYMRVIKNMYSGVQARVRTLVWDTEDFPIDIRLH